MFSRIFILVCIFCFHVLHTYGQSVDTIQQDDIPTDLLEDLSEQSGDESGEFDNNTFLEDLELLSVHKINLNHTTVSELMSTTVLTELQAASIINYTKNYGDFQSIYELKSVIGLDNNTIDLLLPFVTVGEPSMPQYSWHDQLTKGRHTILYRFQMNLEKAKGYTPPEVYQNRLTSRYAGDRTRQYFRYRYQFLKGISYGITLEKDPGEKYFQDNAKLGIDYISAHLFLENKKQFRFIALGDFEVNLGQGLVMWQSFGIGKSTIVNSIQRAADVLKPHTSVIEDQFNRGAGATFQHKNIEITAFASYRLRDGSGLNLDTLTNENIEVQSLQTSGLHRTASELANRANTKLLTTGGRIGWNKHLFSIYLNATYNRLGSNLSPATDMYKRFAFSGRSLFNSSVSYNYLGKKFNIFGEEAFSDNGGVAFLNGLSARLAPGVTLSILHRYYGMKYQTLAGGAFGESSTSNPTNEHGLYAGIRFKIHPKITLNNFVDVFYFPWAKYRIDVPGTYGYEIFHEWQYRHSYKLDFSARFRFENKARNISGSNDIINNITYTKKTAVRLQLNYRPSSNWSFKTRGELSLFNDQVNGLKKGYVFYQDISYKSNSGKFALTGRYAVFKIDDYDARIYTYENDVLYAFSIPALIGSGSRAYLVAKIKLYRRMELWLRYAQMFRSDLSILGSGLEELPGNTRSEIKVQLRVRL